MGTNVDTMRRSPYIKNTTRASGMTYDSFTRVLLVFAAVADVFSDFVHSKHSVVNRASSSGEPALRRMKPDS